MLLKELQPIKAPTPMVSTLRGMVISVKFGQSLKELFPMTVTDSGMMTLSKE